MSVIDNSLLLTAPAGGGLYQVSRSLRFNSGDSAYLNRTPASAGNRKTWTWSGWVKRSSNSGYQVLFSVNNGNSTAFDIAFNGDNFGAYLGTGPNLVTTAVYRDFSAWYHILCAVDTTQATASNRIKLYINGEQITVFSASNYPSQNFDYDINNTTAHGIGRVGGSSSGYFSGYLAEVFLIDGQQLDPSSFTTTDLTTGQLIPKAYTGSYGTNGFKLDFSSNATTAALGTDTSGNSNNWTPNNFSVGFPTTQQYSTTTTGTAPTPFSNTYYALAFDGNTSTAFFWTPGTWAMNWTSLPSAVTVSSSLRIFCYPRLGTLTVNINGSNVASITGNTVDWRTISFTGTINTISFTGTDNYAGVYAIEVNGAILIDPRANSVNDSLVDTPTSYGTDTGVGGEVRGNYATLNPLNNPGGSTLSNGNLDCVTSSSLNGRVVGSIAVSSGKWYWEMLATNVATDLMVGISAASETTATTIPTSATTYLYYNYNGNKYNNGSNSAYGATYTTNDVIGVALDLDAGTIVFYKNGTSQGTAFSSLSGTFVPAFADGGTGTSGFTANFGQRAFAYTAPTGFKALVDTNLPTPVVAKPSTVFDVLLWSGNSTKPRTLSGLNFDVDLIWVKARSDSYNHWLQDSVRGFATGKKLRPNGTDAEGTGDALDIYGYVSGSSSTGFTIDGTGTTGQLGQSNLSGQTYVGWAWDAGTSTVTNTAGSISSQVRANASAGFSVVTYTGNGVNGATVGHGLGVAPSLLICKVRNASDNWCVYHASIGASLRLNLNTTAGTTSGTAAWGTAPTSSVFSIGTSGEVNTNGNTFVCYAFSPVSGYSSFGSYVGNGSSTDNTFVYTGMRPRFVMLKRSDSTGNWVIWDAVRNSYNVANSILLPNSSAAEYSPDAKIDILSNGFKVRDNSGDSGSSGGTYIYAAFAENPFQYARAR